MASPAFVSVVRPSAPHVVVVSAPAAGDALPQSKWNEQGDRPTCLAASAVAAGLVASSCRRRKARVARQQAAKDSESKHLYSQAPILVPDEDGHSNTWLEQADVKTYSDDQLVKMICTLGPASDSVEKIVELIEEGMDVARLNFSHGDHKSQFKTLTALREAVAKTGRSVGVMLDTKGPEIRTGDAADGSKVKYQRGTEVTVTSDYATMADSETIALSYPDFCTSVKVGQPIRIGDGALNLEVTSNRGASSGFVKAEVMNDVEIGTKKNCNIPGVKVQLPLLQDKDVKDLLEFAIPNEVDFIALSFVQEAQSVHDVRKLLTDNCPDGQQPPQLIAKIENAEGLNNFDSILEASDGVMVARGDLGMEIPPERVFLAQKMIIAKCNKAGKFVITATQMLESMTQSPRPTRAEASDVANAVLDGTDCVMLSGETAAGAFPIDSARMMVQICREAEFRMDHVLAYERMADVFDGQVVSPDQGLCNAAVRLALDCNAKIVLALTDSGFSARQIAKFKPPVPIVAVSPDVRVCRALALVRGVLALPVLWEEAEMEDAPDAIGTAVRQAKDMGLVTTGDTIVVVSQIPGVKQEGFNNLLKAVLVE